MHDILKILMTVRRTHRFVKMVGWRIYYKTDTYTSVTAMISTQLGGGEL